MEQVVVRRHFCFAAVPAVTRPLAAAAASRPRGDAAGAREAAVRREFDEVVDVSDAPRVVRRPQLGVEFFVAGASVFADELSVELERAVDDQVAAVL